VILKLPVPPSVNNAFVNVPKRGRVKSKKYKSWLKEADAWYQIQHLHKLKPILGPRSIHIRLPKLRGDASNYIKLVEDYLVSRGLTGDDKLNVSVTIEVDPGETQFCWVTVTEMP
jgi:Holliday junction resolvase RusA-like endonuclease